MAPLPTAPVWLIWSESSRRAAAINEAGGIKGRKIELTVCNDKFDPNTAADCARQAAPKRVVTVIAGYQPLVPQVIPVVEAARSLTCTTASSRTSMDRVPCRGSELN